MIHLGKRNSNLKNGKAGIVVGPLQKGYLLLTLASTLIICIIISGLSYFFFRNYLQNSLLNTTAISLANLNESINTELGNVYRMARYCQSSVNIADYVKASPNPGSVLSVNTYDRLYEEYQNNESNFYIPRVAVIAGSHFLQACQTSYSTTADLAQVIPTLPFFDILANAKGYDFSVGIINDPFSPRLEKPVIPIVRPITYQFNAKQGGYLYLEFTTSLFTDHMQKYYMDQGSHLYLIMGDHYYLYEDNQLKPIYFAPDDIDKKTEYTLNSDVTVIRANIGQKKLTLLSTAINMEGCYLIQEISPATLKSQFNVFLLVIAGIIILISAMGLVLTIFSDRYVHRSLYKIRKKIGETAAGDFSRDPSIEWNHEFGEVGKGINDLSESIEKLLETRLENEKQKRDLEYQMLQSQINPHFLYNTLNSIKMMAAIQGATGIAEMTTALASLLRSIAKGDRLVIPISEELSLVRDYFTIQNYRYGGMISFNIIVDDETITNYDIIKFSLQPLVENSIFHGLEPKGGIGSITIHLSYVDENISIEVIDDGIGIPPDKLAQILNQTTNDKNDFFKEIGISNVNRRIQYEFGKEYGIFVHSAVGSGTTMQIIIPRREHV